MKDVDLLNKLIAEADSLYGTKTDSDTAIARANYKLGLIEAYNDDHEKSEWIDRMDIQMWLHGEYTQDREKGYNKYCNGSIPKYKTKYESVPDYKEVDWKALQAKKDAEEAAKKERSAKRKSKIKTK